MVLRTCTSVEGGLPTSLKTKMMLNIIFDFAIGIVPFVGDIVDAAFKANTRNAALLEAHLREKGKKELRKSGLPIPEVDPSLPEEFDRAQREPSPEYTASQPLPQERMTTGTRQNGRSQRTPTAPAPARVRNEDSRGRGFFGGRSRPTDVEMGEVDRNLTTSSRTKKQRR